MDAGQERFFDYIVERAQDGKQEEVKQLLEESFAKMAEGTMNQEYLQNFALSLAMNLKTEALPEVMEIMQNFAKNLGENKPE